MIMSQVLSFATLMQDKRPVILGNLKFGEQGKSKKCFKLFSFSGCQNSEASNYINDIRHKCLWTFWELLVETAGEENFLLVQAKEK